MRKTITREKLGRIIAESVSEALKYDEEDMDQGDDVEALTQEAIDDMIPRFEALLERFCDSAKRRHPILNDRHNMMEFGHVLWKIAEDF